MTDDAFTPLGRFPVLADPSEVAAFRSATGLADDGETLPLTFPIRWLVGPQIKAALGALIPQSDIVLVHESQTFEYLRPLRYGVPYVLRLVARREVAPDRLTVRGSIDSEDGAQDATLETVLRLFSTAAAAA